PCPETREEPLDEHTRLATGLRREHGDLADEIAGIGNEHRVKTAIANTRLEYRRELDRRGEGSNCSRITVGRDLPTKRRRQAAFAERFALTGLVHQTPGHLGRVIVEPELFGDHREKNNVLVAVGNRS